MQMCNMVVSLPSLEVFGTHLADDVAQTYKEQAQKLAGYDLPHGIIMAFFSHVTLHRPIGLLKMYATRCAQETATDAVQIFGGRGITKTGMGQYIEHVRFLFRVIVQGDQLMAY